MATPTVYTRDEKARNRRMRTEEKRRLGAHIDNLVKQAEDGDEPRGCGAFLGTLLRRLRGNGRARVAMAEVAPAGASSNGIDVHRAVFGLAGASKKADPAAKLAEAASVMRARIEQLEERARDQRKVALTAQKAGQKAVALRELKKAKAVEAQVEANQASLMAVEQQVDMLAQAAMQKTLASALATTSKSMKKDAKALGKAETAIEDAQEARDMASDLNQVMAEFAGNGTEALDEDELLAELEGMVAEDTGPPPPVDAEAAESARLAEIAELEAKLAQRKMQKDTTALHAAAVDAMPAAPTAQPGRANGRKEEKRGLLAGVALSG